MISRGEVEAFVTVRIVGNVEGESIGVGGGAVSGGEVGVGVIDVGAWKG